MRAQTKTFFWATRASHSGPLSLPTPVASSGAPQQSRKHFKTRMKTRLLLPWANGTGTGACIRDTDRRGALTMKCMRFLSAFLPGVLCVLSTFAAGAADADPALIKARQKFFGIENVDEKGRVAKDKVIFSWATNTSYAASLLGRVVLLDSYINRPELPSAPIDIRRTKILPQDFIDARPEAIFLGHGHGDHADNAAYIAKWTGAPIYASPETCDVMQLDVQRMWNDPNLHNGGVKMIPNGDPVNCIGAVPRNSPPGEYTGTLANPATGTTTVRRITQFDPQV